MKSADTNKIYSSSLNKPILWVAVYVFFAILPLFIFLECHKTLVENQYFETRDRTIKYYQRELISFRSRSSNKQIFQQLFQSFRNNFRKNFVKGDFDKRGLLDDLLTELPPGTNLVFWDKQNNLIKELVSSSTFPVSIAQGEAFSKLLTDAHNDFTTGALLQTTTQLENFKQKNKDFLARLYPFVDENFPITQALQSPDKVISFIEDSKKAYFFWDYFNSDNNEQGGFAAIVCQSDLNDLFGVNQVLGKDPTANPDFSNGYFDSTSDAIKLAYPKLTPVAKNLIEVFKREHQSPLIENDWVFMSMPMTETSPYNIFSLFSIKGLRIMMESDLSTARTIAIVIAGLLGFLFFHFFRRNLDHGLSLKKKLSSLFFLCMLLPISVLIFIALQFSLSKEKLLSNQADLGLIDIIERIDTASQDYYRGVNSWLRNLKKLPEITSMNRAELYQSMFAFYKTGKIENFYLVSVNGDIEFDIGNISKTPQSKAFIKELGKRTLNNSIEAHDKSEELKNINQLLTGGFIDLVARNTETLHQVLWPGTSRRKLLYTDIVTTESGQAYAIVATLDKQMTDNAYLKQAITRQFKSNHDFEVFVVNLNDISETFPKITPTFKANLLPLMSTVKLNQTPETDKITDGNNKQLVAVNVGKFVADYLIGARIKWNKIMESIHFIYMIIAAALSFTLLASIFLVTIIVKEFLTPVSIISRGAKDITNGELSLELPVFSKDELGELSSTFNFMTKRLRNRLTELTVLYNLTQKASTSHNQREVFELASENLTKHLGAESGGTGWVNEGEGENLIYLSENRSEEEADSIRNVARKALKTFRTTTHFDEKLSKHILGIPLFFEDKKFGAIYLVFDQSRLEKGAVFSEDENSFIETLRHHLSLIIEKQRLFEQAITDGLTKLYVRRFFMANLDKEVNRSKRYQLDVAIILIDIDHFKKFNDTYGHQAGDHVLKETAQRIVESIRSVDTPGRYGGEEMAVILPQTNIKEGFVVAERIRKAIEGSVYQYKDSTMKVTASVGITALGTRDPSVEELIEEADKALYIAKDNGRNQVRIATEAMQK